MNRLMFNKKWGKYGYEYYTVKCNNRIIGILRNTIYCCTVCRDMTAEECDEYLTKNRYSLEFELMRQVVELGL